MEVIPLVFLKQRNIFLEKGGKPSSLKETIEKKGDLKALYFFDIDGIEKDKPNLCTYQQIQNQEFWVDSGPRDIGDVVDLLLAGAQKVIIRKTLWTDKDLYSVREVTENEIYSFLDLSQINTLQQELVFSSSIDGLILFSKKRDLKQDFMLGSQLKQSLKNFKLIVFDENPQNITYWKSVGAQGILVELGRIKEFTRYDF